MTNAKWIWHRERYACNEYADFKKEVIFSVIDSDAEICISADSEYVLWINDNFVGCGQYDDYPEEKVYDT